MRQRLFFLLLFFSATLLAKNDSIAIFQGYSGGMMVHVGGLFGENPKAISPIGESVSMQGLTYGIGGALRINIKKHLRVGCEGFVSTMGSGFSNQHDVLANGSYVRTGWGGISADACWRGDEVWTYVGGTVGGGATHSLMVIDGNQNDWEPESSAMLNKQGFMFMSPYVGVDWCFTRRIHLTFRVNWMLAFAQKSLLLPTGPRLYVGFMFCH